MVTVAIVVLLPLQRKCSCVLFAVKGNFIMAELSAHAPTAQIVVHSCRMFQKNCLNANRVGDMGVIKVMFLAPVDTDRMAEVGI